LGGESLNPGLRQAPPYKARFAAQLLKPYSSHTQSQCLAHPLPQARRGFPPARFSWDTFPALEYTPTRAAGGWSWWQSCVLLWHKASFTLIIPAHNKLDADAPDLTAT